MSDPVPSVSVILPVFNNARSLPELCLRLRTTFGDQRLQIIAVDDLSTDGSVTVARSLGIELIENPVNLGQNAAILRGLACATSSLIVVMDADLEDQPEQLPLLLSPLIEGASDLVFSSRDGGFRLSSKVFRLVIKLLFPRLPFGACLHFACRRDTADRLLAVADDRDYLVAVLGVFGMRAHMTPISRGQRIHGVTAYPGVRRLRHALRLLAASIRRRLIGSVAGGGGRKQAIGVD